MEITELQGKFDELLVEIARKVQEFHDEYQVVPVVTLESTNVTTHSDLSERRLFVATGEITIRRHGYG